MRTYLITLTGTLDVEFAMELSEDEVSAIDRLIDHIEAARDYPSNQIHLTIDEVPDE